MMDLMSVHKSFIMANIKMVKELANGIMKKEEKRRNIKLLIVVLVVAECMMIMAIRLDSGLI